MANYRRLYVPGGTYFFTLVVQKRMPLFSSSENVQSLREAFKEVMEKRPFKIEAIVVLPDHLHCIWKLPQGDCDFSSRWKGIKYRFSLHCKETFETSESMSQKKEKGLWQRRFWEHVIRDQEDFNRHVDYIHFNPVKHGLVEKPIDWNNSSFNKFVNKGIYPEDWGAMPPVSIQGMELE
jgi:putative transposase